MAILRLRGAETSLSAVAAHADVAGNHVADALAQAGAERELDCSPCPRRFMTVPGSGRG